MSARSHAAGFTLIEVLVALAVIGLALGAFAGAFGNGLVGHRTASDAETALALAENQLALAGATPRIGSSSGDFAGGFAWRATVSSYKDEGAGSADAVAGLPRLYHIAVSVDWRDGRRRREVSLSTLRLGTPP